MASLLDGAGQIKMATLEAAVIIMQRLHGQVELLAVSVKNQQPASGFRGPFQRAATPLVGLLKSQFGSVADIVTGMLLVAGRGGNEQAKVRALRESVGQLRMQLDIAMNKVKEKHAVSAAGASPE
ncbi:MAG: hypothetical protein ABIZ91_12090 [Gemmatimonadaceae bacterium]